MALNFEKRIHYSIQNSADFSREFTQFMQFDTGQFDGQNRLPLVTLPLGSFHFHTCFFSLPRLPSSSVRDETPQDLEPWMTRPSPSPCNEVVLRCSMLRMHQIHLMNLPFGRCRLLA